MTTTFEAIINESIEKNYESILIYSHGGVMRVILTNHLELFDGPIHNTEMISIQMINGKWSFLDKTEN